MMQLGFFASSRRRGALMASVAAVGVAVLAAGVNLPGMSRPGGHSSSLMSQAFAESAAAPGARPAGFADLVQRVKPAVVSVLVRMNATETARVEDDDDAPAMENSPFDRFMRRFGFQDLPRGRRPQPHSVGAQGSGFFVSADGYVVTNNHVVAGAKSVEVVTDDGRTLQAKVVGTDQKTDLAVLKVEGKNFPFVNFSDHDPRIGDWVVAVGNPFGLGGTVTAGIVSARGRNIDSGPYDDYIQIDAPINKGNSGGPTFDVDGSVIGVNTAIYSPSGGSVGIGFDIPAATAKLVIDQLKDHGQVTRGYIGVHIQSVTPEIAESLGLSKAAGALVDDATADGPAAKAGLVSGDVITAVNGTDVKDPRDLARQIASFAPGTTVTVTTLHAGETRKVSLAITKLPDERQANAADHRPGDGAAPHLGLALAPAGEVAGAGDHGVAVTEVDPEGPAAEHGIKEGDVILDVAGQPVATPADVSRQVTAERKQGRHSVLMRIKTSDGTRFVALPLGNA